MVFVIINTDVEGLFYSYAVPAGTCIAFCNIFTEGGFFPSFKLRNRQIPLLWLAFLTISELWCMLRVRKRNFSCTEKGLGKTCS